MSMMLWTIVYVSEKDVGLVEGSCLLFVYTEYLGTLLKHCLTIGIGRSSNAVGGIPD